MSNKRGSCPAFLRAVWSLDSGRNRTLKTLMRDFALTSLPMNAATSATMSINVHAVEMCLFREWNDQKRHQRRTCSITLAVIKRFDIRLCWIQFRNYQSDLLLRDLLEACRDLPFQSLRSTSIIPEFGDIWHIVNERKTCCSCMCCDAKLNSSAPHLFVIYHSLRLGLS